LFLLIARSYRKFHSFADNRVIAPLIAIVVNESTKIYFFSVINSKNFDDSLDNLLLLWIGLQICFTVIFGKISDRYCRKKVLLITILASISSILLLRFDSLVVAIIISGIFGNVLPIAIAGYCDVHVTRGRTPNIFNALLVLPISWIILSVSPTIYDDYLFQSSLIIAIVAAIFVILFFKDIRDKIEKKKAVKKKVFKYNFFVLFGNLAMAYLLLNICWYFLLYYYEAVLSHSDLRKYFFLIVGVSFFFGVLSVKSFKFKPENTIFPAIVFGFFIILFDALMVNFNITKAVSADLFFQHTFFMGIVQPLIYSYFGKRVSLHKQGITYGFLDSVNSSSELVAIAILPLLVVTKVIYMVLLICAFFACFLTWNSYRKRSVSQL
jgi:MFS family permease